jgi:hypothetical protein
MNNGLEMIEEIGSYLISSIFLEGVKKNTEFAG